MGYDKKKQGVKYLMEYYFKAEKMTVGYDGNAIIENINFSIKKGEILTIIGPNGAGKSTILKSITRQLEKLDGAVYIGNKNQAEMSANELARNMAVVSTKPIKAELMTCEDVVATGRYPYTGRFGLLSHEDKEIAKEAMKLVNVYEIKDRDFSKISDGQRQRIMLAKAICQNPQIIVLDEPTSYLDIKYKLEFLSVLQQLKRQKNLTVIMSLHELELAERISDKMLCVSGKYIDRFGTPEEIFNEGYISRLFDIKCGNFDEIGENTELAPPLGKPNIFVIAGCGSGRKIFRKLQRSGKAFFAGIINQNDLDYPSAKALAAKIVETEAFEPVSNEFIETAKRLIDLCDKVICVRHNFGVYEEYNRKLYEYAVKCDKLMGIEDI